MSYCDTAVELPFANDGVPGFPAYTVPEVPFGLNTEPGAETEPPGVAVLPRMRLPQVLGGAPGWPGPWGWYLLPQSRR